MLVFTGSIVTPIVSPQEVEGNAFGTAKQEHTHAAFRQKAHGDDRIPVRTRAVGKVTQRHFYRALQGVPIDAARSHPRQARADALVPAFAFPFADGAGNLPRLGSVFIEVQLARDLPPFGSGYWSPVL
jgi:hypothetical protein